jgi:predicted glycosyl hydrolase (DUF1957 family)
MDADELIKQLNSILEVAKSNLQLYDNAQSYYDKKEQDVLHKIEFDDVSDSESIELVKVLKRNRIDRRKLKNDRCKYQIIVEIAPVLTKLNKLDKKIVDKFYTPKVMPEIFAGSNNKTKSKKKKKKNKLQNIRKEEIKVQSDTKQFLNKTQDLLERFDYDDLTDADGEVVELYNTLETVYGLPIDFESKLKDVFDYLLARSFRPSWHITYGQLDEDNEWVIDEDNALDFISSVTSELEELLEE